MEMAFAISIILLSLFSLLGLYDGLYLHILKYRLYEHPESRFEHLSHTIRGLLFPAILYFLYLANDAISLAVGICLVLVDIVVLGIDAFVEKDSRLFMGGLPRWEYIIHLFVNGFHFAAIAVFMVVKFGVNENQFFIRPDFSAISNYSDFTWLVKNLIPGAIFMALLHVIVLFPGSAKYWNRLLHRCCA